MENKSKLKQFFSTIIIAFLVISILPLSFIINGVGVVPVIAASNDGFGLSYYNSQTNPEDFYFWNSTSGAYDVAYEFTDYGGYVEVKIKNLYGYSLYQIHDDPVGIRLFDSRNLVVPLVSTSFFVPQRWSSTGQGKWSDYAISATVLTYSLYDDYVVVNRTSTAGGTTQDRLVESYRFGVDANGMLHKVTAILDGQSETEVHRFSWSLTGIQEISSDLASHDGSGTVAYGDLNIDWLDTGEAGVVETWASTKKAQITWSSQVGDITLDPSLSVTEAGSELRVVNTWDAGASGYNFTILTNDFSMNKLYDYAIGDYVFNATLGDSDSHGLHFSLQNTTNTYFTPQGHNIDTVTVQEESDTRIKILLHEESFSTDFNIDWTITCYAGTPIFFINVTWTALTSQEIDTVYFTTSESDDNDAYGPSFTEDNTDEVYGTNSTTGGLGYITLAYNDEAGNDWDDGYTPGDSFGIQDYNNRILSINETVSFTIGFYVHSQTTNAEALIDELDDEICDAFPAITSVTGLTSNNRNNSTGAFDFTHASGNDGSFVFTDVDTEQNFTAIHVDAWNLATYTVWVDDVLKTEDTDYYAYYNATSLDLDIVYSGLSTATVKIASAHSDWGNFLKLTVDKDDVSAALTNFPALVKLSTSSGINSYDASAVFDNVTSDSNAIAFYASDNSTRLYFEVESWNATSEVAWIWVKIPSVSNTSNTVFWLGYDSKLDGSNWHVPSSVWDANFKMVQHMNDATTSTVLDSTINDNDGTKKGINEPIEATGKIGNSQQGDGIDDKIIFTDAPEFDDANKISVELWFKSVDTVNFQRIMWRLGAYGLTTWAGDGKIYGSIYSGGLWYDSAHSLTNVCDGVLHHIVFTHDATLGASNMKIWVDNVLEVETTLVKTIDASASDLQLFIEGVASLPVTGIEDEFRFSAGRTYSSAWVGASYETQRDNFLVLGSASPVNSDAQVTNLDDTDNLYAQLREYTLTYNGTHADGYASFTTVDLTLQTGGATERLTIRYDEDADTFTEQSGATTAWELVTGSSSSTKSGTSLDLTVALKCEWDATEESDLDIKSVATDHADNTDTDTFDVNIDVVTNLVVSGVACDDDRGNPSQTITFTGTVYYANSPASSTATTFYPPDAEFTSVSIYDDWNNNEGTDSSIVNGAFSVAFTANATVGIETYNTYINMTDADYTDAEESPTDTYIADGLKLVSIQSPAFLDNGDFSFQVQTQYAYNTTGINAGVVRIVHQNGTELTTGFTANATGWATVVLGQTNSSSAGTYTIIGHTEPDHSIIAMNANQTFVLRTWTLQARDAAGTNLPRSVVFTVTSGGSAFDAWTSSTAGISDTIYAPNATTYLVDTTWGTHTVDSAESITLSGNTASTIDTKIQRLDDSTNYILMSLDNTDLPTPTLSGEANVLLHNTVASGSLEFKADHANWKVIIEPDRFDAGTSQYNKGDGTWAWANSIFTLTSTYSGTQDLLLYFTYTAPSGGGGGGGSVPYVPPEDTTPPEAEEPEDTTPTLPTITIPDIPDDEKGILVIGGIIAGVIALGAIGGAKAKNRKKTAAQAQQEKQQRKTAKPDYSKRKTYAT